MAQADDVGAVKAISRSSPGWPTVQDGARPGRRTDGAWAGLAIMLAQEIFKSAGISLEKMNGVFSRKSLKTIKLPEVGAYTASAIAAIACGTGVVVDAISERMCAIFAKIRRCPGKAEIRTVMGRDQRRRKAPDAIASLHGLWGHDLHTKIPKCGHLSGAKAMRASCART